jgi:hypothetical protein
MQNAKAAYNNSVTSRERSDRACHILKCETDRKKIFSETDAGVFEKENYG